MEEDISFCEAFQYKTLMKNQLTQFLLCQSDFLIFLNIFDIVLQ